MFFDRFKTKAHPVEIVQTPVADNKVVTQSQFARNVSRLVTLYQAKEQGDTRADVAAELEQRAKACVEFGHPAPQNLAEAIALKQKVIK